MDDVEFHTVGRPDPAWYRFVPRWVHRAWHACLLVRHDFREGRRLRLVALSSSRNRRLTLYLRYQLDRLDDRAKDRLIAAWAKELESADPLNRDAATARVR